LLTPWFDRRAGEKAEKTLSANETMNYGAEADDLDFKLEEPAF
jgi:hypothetical protein